MTEQELSYRSIRGVIPVVLVWQVQISTQKEAQGSSASLKEPSLLISTKLKMVVSSSVIVERIEDKVEC